MDKSDRRFNGLFYILSLIIITITVTKIHSFID